MFGIPNNPTPAQQAKFDRIKGDILDLAGNDDDHLSGAICAILIPHIIVQGECIADLEESLLMLEKRLPPLESFERENMKIGNVG